MPFPPIFRHPWLLGLAGLCLALARAVAAESDAGVGEYEVKAAFLYNLTKFTDWPPGAFSSVTAPIVIGIVGENPFGNAMYDIVRGEVVHGRPLVVKRMSVEENLRVCHLLFISRSETPRLSAMLGQLKGSPVLTVSEINGFGDQGGMVNLVLVNKTVKIEINLAATEQTGLQISAKLLKLARVVKPSGGRTL